MIWPESCYNSPVRSVLRQLGTLHCRTITRSCHHSSPPNAADPKRRPATVGQSYPVFETNLVSEDEVSILSRKKESG